MKVPVTYASITEWVRLAATAINRSVQRDGATIYNADVANVTYDQTQMQALMDAVEALSNRVK